MCGVAWHFRYYVHSPGERAVPTIFWNSRPRVLKQFSSHRAEANQQIVVPGSRADLQHCMAHEWLRAILRWAVSQTDLNRHRLREDLKRAVELLASIGTSAGKEAPITVVARALSDPSPRVGGGFISTLAPPQPVLRTVTSGDIHDEAANTTSPVASAADLERRSTASVYRAQYSYMQAATARMLSPDSTPEGFRPGNGMGMLAPRSLLNSVPGWEQRAEALAVMNKASRQNDPGGVINRFVRAETRFVRAFRGVRSTRASPESSSSST